PQRVASSPGGQPLDPAAGGCRPLAPAAALLELYRRLVLLRRRGVAGRARIAQGVPCGVLELVGAPAGRAVVVARLQLADAGPRPTRRRPRAGGRGRLAPDGSGLGGEAAGLLSGHQSRQLAV